MVFEPAADVDQERKAGRVALRKAVFAKPFNLLEQAVGKFLRVAVRHHRTHQALVKMVHAAPAFPGGHGAAQAVGLATAEVRSGHGDLHHLFLEYGYAQGALQHFLQCRAGVLHRLRVGARLQIRMDHAALNRAGPHDGHLHHQVVIAARLQARQHAHLRPALDLEHAHGVGAANHVVGRRVFGRNVLQAHGFSPPLADQIQTAVDGAEHAQGQHVHFEQAHGVQIVFVPLDDAALRHGRVLHRNDAGERTLREHKTAHVLAEVAREALQSGGQLQPLLQAAW